MDKVVVVTGGSRGIGRAVSLLAAQRGWKVLIAYASDDGAAAETKAEIAAGGGTAATIRADVSKEDEVAAIFKAADALGPLGALVNSAGVISNPPGPFMALTAARISRILLVNVMGTMLCCKEAVARLSTRRGGPGGAIVNLSSMSGIYGGPNRTIDYATTKGAINTFTVGLAKEVAPDGIRVNAVSPGPTNTDIITPEHRAYMATQIPWGRIAEPEEIAYPILWLLSDEASYVTGENMFLGGAR